MSEKDLVAIGHNDFQVGMIVAQAGLHPWARYQQTLMEIHKRQRLVKRFQLDRDKLQIEMERLLDEMAEVGEAISSSERELRGFEKLRDQLKGSIGEVENRDLLDREAEMAKLHSDVQMHVIAKNLGVHPSHIARFTSLTDNLSQEKFVQEFGGDTPQLLLEAT